MHPQSPLFCCRCNNNGAETTVSIAIVGGSEPAGSLCTLKHKDGTPKESVPPTDFLDLPLNLSRELILGNDECPWGNRLKTLLKSKYPQCRHIDVYNLAERSTDTTWALKNMHALFNTPNSARGGRTIGEAVDVVLIDYLNDGFLKNHQIYAQSVQIGAPGPQTN